MYRSIRIATIFTILGFCTTAFAQSASPTDYSTVEITKTDLGHNTYMLQGKGGNITVAVGADGAIMVDGEFAPLHDKIKAAIGTITDEPVRYLVDTHFHGDHSGGNAPFAKDGAIVVAHTNVQKSMAEGTTNILTGAKTEPVSGEALPTRTYDSDLTLKVGKRTAKLAHIAHAHTDGDTYAYFKDADVLSTGDIVTIGGRYPNIDIGAGGNIKGIIAGVDIFLKLADDATKIVPGHGPLLTKADLRTYRTMLVAARDRVAKLIKDGKSIDEAVLAKPLSDLDAQAGADSQGSENFVRLIYMSLKPR